jgi:hypothetical protein
MQRFAIAKQGEMTTPNKTVLNGLIVLQGQRSDGWSSSRARIGTMTLPPQVAPSPVMENPTRFSVFP